MKDAVLFNSALHRRYTALCGLAPASLCFEAVWWSQVEGSPGGWKSNDAQCSRQGQVVSMDERYPWLRSLRLLLLYAGVTDNPSITSHIFTSSVLYSQHLSVQLTNARCIHSLGLLREWSWCWENSCLSVCPHRLQGSLKTGMKYSGVTLEQEEGGAAKDSMEYQSGCLSYWSTLPFSGCISLWLWMIHLSLYCCLS